MKNAGKSSIRSELTDHRIQIHWYLKPIEETYVDEEGNTRYSVGSGTVTNMRIQGRNEPKEYFENKVRLLYQVFDVSVSKGGTRDYSTYISWGLYDLNNNGEFDRLLVRWSEPRTPVIRMIFCHIE